MPRLPPSFLRLAHSHHPLLPTLLPECRTIPQSISELRWLREFAQERQQNLRALCKRRGRGEPLQYILGTQPFGELEVLCRRGVLIPRPETEHLISNLFLHLSTNLPRKRSCRVLDLCTGTGCIPLHLYSLLSSVGIAARCIGVDISPHAVSLASDNLRHNISLGVLPVGAREDVVFVKADVLDVDALVAKLGLKGVDVVVSNPPYISPRGFNMETARSVRNYEPRLALVPSGAGGGGDGFYPVVAEIAGRLGAGIVVVEVGGWEQGRRVKRRWVENGWAGSEVWGDYAGKGRGVVAWREGWEWVKDGLVVGREGVRLVEGCRL